jgi:hypothetical protein
MKLKAQVDKQIQLGEESFRIVIQDKQGHGLPLSFNQLSGGLDFIYSLLDDRLHDLCGKVIEDGLIEHLSEEDQDNFVSLFTSLFKDTNEVDTNRVNVLINNMTIQITKMTGVDEGTTIELSDFLSINTVVSEVHNVLSALDERVSTLNTKGLTYHQNLQKHPYEKQMAYKILMDVLFGRTQPDHAKARVDNYFDDLSVSQSDSQSEDSENLPLTGLAS